jgi:predicted acylesterase/phospholipase RssA
MFLDNDIPKKQRALVLQGGGALGAYESGVVTVLCNKISEESGPLFGVVAGTSMGAMNAAVLVGNVKNRNKTWVQAAKELENFWTDGEKGLSSTPDPSKWWWAKKNPHMPNIGATEEAAKKYYSVKEYFKHGTPNVCWPLPPIPDVRFADPDNTWFVNSSEPLQKTIERYSKVENNENLRIATNWNNKEPRLLVVSVDIAEGKTVTFDSYHKKDENSEDSVYEGGDGITIDHVMASGTIPLFYNFREIGGRKFCDGGILSNTPFRELLQAHRDYWTRKVGGNRHKIPDLEVYIVNVHPTKMSIDMVPQDYDRIKDRINDITYSDRNSHYDEMITDLVTDYMELAVSSGSTVENRKYKDLIKGRFKLTKVVRIEPENYTDNISGKGADFTAETISSLIEKGKEDALKVLK